MNIYFIGMCIAMVVFVGISIVISRKVKDANDFYVAGRSAPLVLVTGSMIASYASTGMFMGDAAEAFEGALSPMLLFAGMQSAGYLIGAVFFGRYLRRSNVLTIPEFFGKRFCSNKMRVLSAVTAIIMMTVYYLSVIQGVGTLMNLVTGIDYNICIVLSIVVLTTMTVISGSRGVLITDTLMMGLFTIGLTVPAKLTGYMAASRPIVAAISGDSKDIIEKSECGICVNAGDVEGLAAGMLRCIEKQNTLQEMGCRGRKYFLHHFTKDVFIADFVNKLGLIIDQHNQERNEKKR